MTALIAKPKHGKSTLARQAIVAVADGKPFLGRESKQGEALYFAIEELASEVNEHFEDLGLSNIEAVHVRYGAVDTKTAVAALEAALRGMDNVKLVVVDTLFKFVPSVDVNDYGRVKDVLQPLSTLATRYGVHILFLHHAKKNATEDTGDGTLGSSAIRGEVTASIYLKKDSSGVLTIESERRYGKPIERTQLVWDEETRSFSLGRTAENAAHDAAQITRVKIQAEMIAYVTANPGCTRDDIIKGVGHKTQMTKKVFSDISENCFVRSGPGTRGKPHTFSIRPIPTETGAVQ